MTNYLVVKTEKEGLYYFYYTLAVYKVKSNEVSLIGSTTYSGGSNAGDEREVLKFLLDNKEISKKKYDLLKNESWYVWKKDHNFKLQVIRG